MANFYEEHLTDDIVRQRHWSEEELKSRGYTFFERKKMVVMGRKVSEEEGSGTIITKQGDTLVYEAGYIICYFAGNEVFDNLAEYEQWPVAPTIFAQSYKTWDDPEWKPSPAEKKLMDLGCRPYYKFAGVWVRRSDGNEKLQSLEHTSPVTVKEGDYIAIGIDGEPYSMGETTLHNRYKASRQRLGDWVKRLLTGR